MRSKAYPFYFFVFSSIKLWQVYDNYVLLLMHALFLMFLLMKFFFYFYIHLRFKVAQWIWFSRWLCFKYMANIFYFLNIFFIEWFFDNYIFFFNVFLIIIICHLTNCSCFFVMTPCRRRWRASLYRTYYLHKSNFMHNFTKRQNKKYPYFYQNI